MATDENKLIPEEQQRIDRFTDIMKKLTPEERQMIDRFAEMMRKDGMSEDDIKMHFSVPFNRKFALRVGELRKYKLVAEVIRSRYCDLKEGQKFVFSCAPTNLLVNECTARLCIKALGPMGTAMVAFWDRILEGVEPNGGAWEYVQCLDQGLRNGARGNVLFKLYAVKSETPPGPPPGGPPQGNKPREKEKK